MAPVCRARRRCESAYGAQLSADQSHRLDPTREFIPVRIAVLTISDTRDLATDTSGALLAARIEAAGHVLAARVIEKDDVPALIGRFRTFIADPLVDVVISTGGTGLTGRDVTPEALSQVVEKVIDGFSILFHHLSFEKIGTSTIQSRAMAGVANGTYLFALPGSGGAVKDGWDGILKWQLDNRHRPCNFVEIMPRLTEHQR